MPILPATDESDESRPSLSKHTGPAGCHGPTPALPTASMDDTMASLVAQLGDLHRSQRAAAQLAGLMQTAPLMAPEQGLRRPEDRRTDRTELRLNAK